MNVSASQSRVVRPVEDQAAVREAVEVRSRHRPATEAEMVGSDLVSDEDDDPADTAHAKALIRVKTWARICTNSGSVLVAI